MTRADDQPRDVFRHAGFTRFWTAQTVSEFGSYITTLALQVLVVVTLHGSAADVGFLNASRWLPYLLLGLIVGALVDRRRRQPILVITDFGRGVLLGAIPLLWLGGMLTLPVLMVFMVVFGTLSLLNDAASQSLLPRLVPQSSLLSANDRLDQSASVAQTSGPVVAGGLMTRWGHPSRCWSTHDRRRCARRRPARGRHRLPPDPVDRRRWSWRFHDRLRCLAVPNRTHGD